MLSTRVRAVAFAVLLPHGSCFALKRPRGRASIHMQVGGAFPSAERWKQHLLSEPPPAETPAVPVLVLQQEEYADWLAAQSDERQAYLAAAGLSTFKDDKLVLLPEKRWAFLTKNASSLFAFSSLPSRLPTDATYALESSLPLPPTAALSWGLGCYSFDACKGSLTRKRNEGAPPKFASLVVPGACDATDTATALSGTFLCRDLINAPAADMGPAELESATRSLAAACGASVSTVEGEALLQGYPQIHAARRPTRGSRGSST